MEVSEIVVAMLLGGAACRRALPGAEVVAAFNSVPSEVLFGVFEARGKAAPPSLVYCGDGPRGRVTATIPARYRRRF